MITHDKRLFVRNITRGIMTTFEAFTQKQAYIDGTWHSAENGKPWQLYHPATGEVLLNTELATSAEAEKAIEAAARAFTSWRQTSRETRAQYLEKIADAFEAKSEYLAMLSVKNNGKLRLEADIDVADAIACYRYYADLIRQQPTQQTLPAPEGMTLIKESEPIGVCALIVPWNFPMVTTAWKLAPALAAGCTVILKPSEYTLLPELVLGDILTEVNLPKGVVNIVAGDADVGQLMSTHPLINKVSFTGSNAVGESVMRQAASGVKSISLELGGKSAFIVCEDVDLDAACEWIAAGIFFNAGQICSATSRLLIPESIAQPLLERLKLKAENLIVGAGEDDNSTMGAITNEAQYRRIQQYFSIAKEENLPLITGGHTIGEHGWFIAPTIYAPVPTSSQLWQEEIFGPVLVCATYRDISEAIKLANESIYGLVATVASASVENAMRIAKALRVGHIWINSE